MVKYFTLVAAAMAAALYTTSCSDDSVSEPSNKGNTLAAILVDYTDTTYIDSVIYIQDENGSNEFETLVQMDSCAKEWEDYKVKLSNNKVYLCKEGSWSLYEENALENATVSGVAQKGPFAYHTPITLTELTPDLLEKTENSYSDSISGNMGEFVIPKVTLKNPIVEADVHGSYLNEITGNWTKTEATLQAISELSQDSTSKRDSLNINLLTHLEFPRVKQLYLKGYPLAAAKKQAQQEIMNALGIGKSVEFAEDLNLFGSRDGDGLLTAISLLFLRNQDDATALKNIEAFREDLADDGVWNDSTLKKSMADWAYSFKESDISANISNWNIADVSSYTSYLNQFWANEYGLGLCNYSREGLLLQNKTAPAKSRDNYFICKYGKWYEATTLEKDTYLWEDGKVGDIRKGNITDSVYEYSLNYSYYSYGWNYSYLQTLFQICDSTKYGMILLDSNEVYRICKATGITQASAFEYNTYEWAAGKDGDVKAGNVDTQTMYVYDSDIEGWRTARNSIEETYGACTEARNGKTYVTGSDSITCSNKNWHGIISGSIIDGRDGHVYKTVTIGSQTWMAENLNYIPTIEPSYSWCYTDDEGSDGNCLTQGRYYRWANALGQYNAACGYSSTCSISTPVQGVCPDGWHIPTTAEWQTLKNYVTESNSNGAYALSATTTWDNNNGTDKYGFAAKAFGYRSFSSGFESMGTAAEFQTATQYNSSNGYYISIGNSTIITATSDKDFARSVRCIKNN